MRAAAIGRFVTNEIIRGKLAGSLGAMNIFSLPPQKARASANVLSGPINIYNPERGESRMRGGGSPLEPRDLRDLQRRENCDLCIGVGEHFSAGSTAVGYPREGTTLELEFEILVSRLSLISFSFRAIPTLKMQLND